MKHELSWQENRKTVKKSWLSEADFSAPKRILIANDELKADEFYRQASEGAAFIYRGDFQNAKQLLQAVQRRIDKSLEQKQKKSAAIDFNTLEPKARAELFHKHRQTQSHKAQLLSRLLIEVNADLSISLKRAPDLKIAITQAMGDSRLNELSQQEDFLLSLRELLGYIGASEWRKKGVQIPALGATIHPHYGLFSPSRGEYLDLIQAAPLPNNTNVAFDIGTGTGVIAALLAKRSVTQIVATDLDSRAIHCAKENIERLGYSKNIKIVQADMFPDGKADLIVCNPPWLPVRPTTSMERALYDENSGMLKKFLANVGAHLNAQGEAWLIISNLAELLGLRESTELSGLFSKAKLQVIDCLETKPKHKKAEDAQDPLHFARSNEITRLWRLKLLADSL